MEKKEKTLQFSKVSIKKSPKSTNFYDVLRVDISMNIKQIYI